MQRPPLYDANATVVLIGMRGVGKTTLGLIAATSLRRAFIDADSAFQTLYRTSISDFVGSKGWPAFRDAEAAILKKLIEEHPTGCVIACGGGVVEREENRELLARFRDSHHPVVHVVRDKDETIRYLVNEEKRPSWGEEIRHVWARRTPWFESLCTHTIVSTTIYPPPASPQMLMKHVETAFVRLLRSIFGLASSHVPLLPGPRPPPIQGPSSGEYGGYGACESEMGRGAKGPQTFFSTLNWPDLRVVSAEAIKQVTGGADVIELRVDCLMQPIHATPPDSRRGSPDILPSPHRSIPSPHFVSLCFGHLRRCSPLPILYTVRSQPQGGEYPDPYDGSDPQIRDNYIALLELGFKLGAEYVDLELSLPDAVIKRLLRMRGAATLVVAADHAPDRQWDSQEMLDKFIEASKLGVDIIKFVSTPKSFDDNIDLYRFRQRVAALVTEGKLPRAIPFLAHNVGKSGQLSRFLNPVFIPVTHPLLPAVAAPGQLTYAQTQQALYLSGLTLEKRFYVPSEAVARMFTHKALDLGLPYSFVVRERINLGDEPEFGGAFLGNGALESDTVLQKWQSQNDILPPALASGWIDLIVPSCTEPTTYHAPPMPIRDSYKHTNVRVLALAEIITQNLSPINAVGVHTSALLVGLEPKDRSEVIEALALVGARWVFLHACIGDETTTADVLRAHESKSQPPSRPGTPLGGGGGASGGTINSSLALPYPQSAPLTTITITSLSSASLYTRRPPTIVIAGSAAPAFPDALFSSPTGGCALDLSTGLSDQFPRGHGTLWRAVMEDGRPSVTAVNGHRPSTPGRETRSPAPVRRREGWQMLGPDDVEVELCRQAFRALTGRRLI